MTLPQAPRHNPLTPAQVDTARKIAADSVLLATLSCPKVSADMNNKASQMRTDRAAMDSAVAASRITAIGDAVTGVISNKRSSPDHVQLDSHAGSQLSAPTSKVTGKRALKRLTVPEDVLLGSAVSIDLFATQRLKPALSRWISGAGRKHSETAARSGDAADSAHGSREQSTGSKKRSKAGTANGSSSKVAKSASGTSSARGNGAK